MIVTIRQSDQAAEHYRVLWTWCYQNGFLATEVANTIVVNTDRGTVSIQQLLPVSQPGHPDFPELRRDEFDQPLSEHRELPLVAPVPKWMATQNGGHLAA